MWWRPAVSSFGWVMTYEMRIQGFAGVEEALAMQETVARVLCPVAEHDGPCEVPWGFTVVDGDLVLGVFAAPEKAVEVAERVRGVVGGREVALSEGRAGRFDDLEEQYRIEHRG
jgi:hypothetical protein